MEYIIVIFLGGWLILASLLAYRQLKKDFSSCMEQEEKKE